MQKSDTYKTDDENTMQDNVVHLQNKASVCDLRDTQETQRRSLKVLADRYQAADDHHKPGIAFYLRKVFRAFNANP